MRRSAADCAEGALHDRMRASGLIAKANARMSEMAEWVDGELLARTIPELVWWCQIEKRRLLAELGREELIGVWKDRQARDG